MTREIKGTRKRRLLRSSSATLLDSMMPDDTSDGPFVKWSPTAKNWQDIAKACEPLDLPLNTADAVAAAHREEIGRLVGIYFETEPFEPGAPFVADVNKHLDKLQTAADKFHQVLLSSDALEKEIERNAADHAKMLIKIRLEEWHCALRSIGDFAKTMEMFLTAVAVARHKLSAEEDRPFEEGKSWGRLVKGLALWFESKGLRVTASKGDIGKPSAFVAFMWELQSTFPERFRRYHHSIGALAKAISDTLAGR